MADRQSTSRRGTGTAQGSRQQPRRGVDQSNKSSSPRRSDVIRCEKCGEDYSITYKRCPFCDERPSRGGISGRRVAEHNGPVNPIQIITLVVSLIIVIAALYIVFTYVGPLIFGNSSSGGQSSQTDTSQGSGSSGGNQSQSAGQSGQGSGSVGGDGSSSTGGDGSQTTTPSGTVTSITLNKTDYTLWYEETFEMEASLTPAGVDAQVTWTSSNPTVLPIDEDGIVQNLNSGTSTVNVTITAACGDQTATCIVRCRPAQSSSEETGEEPTGGETGGSGTGTLEPNTLAVVVNAGTGLNVRSGPGTSYDRVASISNGDEVTILEAADGGWYRVDIGGSVEGYVLGDYLSPR